MERNPPGLMPEHSQSVNKARADRATGANQCELRDSRGRFPGSVAVTPGQ